MLDAVLNLMLAAEALLLVGIIGAALGCACWFLRGWLLNLPARIREAMRPALHYGQRVHIVGGFYAGYAGVLKERNDAYYTVEIEGMGQKTVAIYHLRPLLPPALPAPKMDDACLVSYQSSLLVQEMGDE